MFLQFLQHLSFDLTHTFASNPEFFTHLLQRMRNAILQTKSHFNNLSLSSGKILKHVHDILSNQLSIGGFTWRKRFRIFNEITQLTVFFRTNGSLERNDILRNLQNMTDLLNVHSHFSSQLFNQRLTPQFLNQTALRMSQFIDGLDHVNRNTNCPRLVRNGTGNGLTNPPRGIG